MRSVSFFHKDNLFSKNYLDIWSAIIIFLLLAKISILYWWRILEILKIFFNLLFIKIFRIMNQNDLVRKNRARLSKRLYHNLPTWEISVWTGSWIFAVGYSMYHLFFASKRELCWDIYSESKILMKIIICSNTNFSVWNWYILIM